MTTTVSTLSTLPEAPTREMASSEFAEKADLFLPGLNTLQTEMNTSIGQINTVAGEINTNAAIGNIAMASSNFKGLWTAQTGSAVVPYCVYHLSKYWQLTSNIADVTTKIPGTAVEWIQIPYLLDYDHDVNANGYLQTNTVFKDTSEKVNVLGTKTTSTAISIADGNIATIQIGASLTLSFTNWSPSGEYSELMIVMTNGGAYTLTWPTVNWLLSTGAFTTTFANQPATLQSSGIDFIFIWTINGGSTLYGKIVR